MGNLTDQMLSYGKAHNESKMYPGHEKRMQEHIRRVHTALGPMVLRTKRSRKVRYCDCEICKKYRQAKMVGPEHVITN